MEGIYRQGWGVGVGGGWSPPHPTGNSMNSSAKEGGRERKNMNEQEKDECM